METKERSKVGEFIKAEMSNWTKQEILWLATAQIILLGLSLYWGDNFLGIFCSVCGVFCVVLVGKGKISNYFFGVINVTLYAFIAYEQGYYGDTMLNLAYYLPMNIIGFFLWKKHTKSDTGEVEKIRLTKKNLCILGLVSTASVGGYAMFLDSLGGSLPLLDSISTVFSLVAQYLCAIRATEQWIFWIIVNVVSVMMWLTAFLQGSDGIATLLMWCVYLVNAIIMLIAWNKDTKAE